MVLAAALAAVLVALAAVLLTGPAAPSAAPTVTATVTHPASSTHPASPKAHKSAKRPAAGAASTLPPVAAAAATFVGDLEVGVADGQVAPQAGQDLYNHLQQLLFGPPGQSPQQIQQQYARLVQSFDQHRQQGQITGHAAIALRHALRALGAAVGAL